MPNLLEKLFLVVTCLRQAIWLSKRRLPGFILRKRCGPSHFSSGGQGCRILPVDPLINPFNPFYSNFEPPNKALNGYKFQLIRTYSKEF
jgi:hypothetical protein